MTSLDNIQIQVKRLLTSSSNFHELEAAYEHYSGNISSHAISLELSKFMLALCHCIEPKSILDLGSGFSSFVFRQYKEADVVSVDNNANWIDITREYLASQGLQDSNLVLWDYLDRSMKFDLVSYDLGRMPVRRKELAQAFHLAKPETGIIILDDVHKGGYREYAKSVIDERGYEMIDLRDLTLDQYGRHSWLVRKGKMKPLNTIYPTSYFGRRSSLNWRAPIVCGALNDIIKPKKVVDVGCAIGDLVKGWLDLGVDAYGVEGSPGAKEFLEVPDHRILFHDLRERLPNWSHDNVWVNSTTDLVTCFEVAEHIEEEYADQFVDNLVFLEAPEILISAAPPGQGGHYHVNCQPYEYWVEKFRARGYARVKLAEEKIKKALAPWRHKAGVKAYYNNLLYFWNGE